MGHRDIGKGRRNAQIHILQLHAVLERDACRNRGLHPAGGGLDLRRRMMQQVERRRVQYRKGRRNRPRKRHVQIAGLVMMIQAGDGHLPTSDLERPKLGRRTR